MKIATLLPSATEIVCALGLQDALVAVSHECDYPESVKTLPPITSSILPHALSPKQVDDAVVAAVREGKALYQVDGDLLARLQPDLIITQGVCDVCAVNQGTVEETLTFLPDVISDGVTVLTLSGANVAGMLRDIQQVATATGKIAEAGLLIQALKDRWAHVLSQKNESNPKVLMLEWPAPYFYGGHWVPEMVEAAGGIDVLGQPGLESGRCTAQEIIDRDPDIIVSIACGHDLAKNVEFGIDILQTPEFQSLKAIRNGQVWAVDANSYFSRPAPRIIDGAEKLQAIFTNQADGLDGVQKVIF